GFAACDTAWDGHAHGASEAADQFRAALPGALGGDAEVAAQIRAARLETEVGPRFHFHHHEAAFERSFAGNTKAGAGSGQRWHDEFVLFRAVRIRGIVHAHFECRAAQKFLEAKLNFLRDVAFDASAASRSLFFLRVGQGAV